jgi:hypothetical protein
MSRKLGPSQVDGTHRGVEREVCGISYILVSRVEIPREGGNVRGTPLDLSSFIFLSLSLFLFLTLLFLVHLLVALVVTVTIMVTVT